MCSLLQSPWYTKAFLGKWEEVISAPSLSSMLSLTWVLNNCPLTLQFYRSFGKASLWDAALSIAVSFRSLGQCYLSTLLTQTPSSPGKHFLSEGSEALSIHPLCTRKHMNSRMSRAEAPAGSCLRMILSMTGPESWWVSEWLTLAMEVLFHCPFSFSSPLSEYCLSPWNSASQSQVGAVIRKGQGSLHLIKNCLSPQLLFSRGD